MTRLYAERAELYDVIYAPKPYAREAERLVALLDGLGVPRGGRIVEAGIGTGSHAVHLRAHYRVEGFDRSEAMLAVARRKLPDVRLWCADMGSFTVAEPVDAMLCLFSAIGYLLDEEALHAAASAMAAAVRPGGALIVEPWLTVEEVDVGRPSLQIAEEADLKIARASTIRLEGEIAVTPMHYVVARRGGGVESFQEEHRLWCAPRALLVRVFEEAGFDTRFEADGLMQGRGLVVGTRR